MKFSILDKESRPPTASIVASRVAFPVEPLGVECDDREDREVGMVCAQEKEHRTTTASLENILQTEQRNKTSPSIFNAEMDGV